MLDDVECRDEFEGVVAKRKAVGGRLRHLRQTPSVAVLDRLRVDIDALGSAKPGQVRQHGSGSAADVEDAAIACGAGAEVPVEDRQEDPPAGDEPPVDILHLVVFPVELSLQFSREPG